LRVALQICLNNGLRPKPLSNDLASLASSAVGIGATSTVASPQSGNKDGVSAFLDSSSSSPFLSAGAPPGSPEPVGFDKIAKRPVARTHSKPVGASGYSAVGDGSSGSHHFDDTKSIDSDASVLLDNCLACERLKHSAELQSSLFVRVTFGWLNPLMSAGNHHQIRQDELLNLNKDDDPGEVDAKFTQMWREELQRPNPNLIRAFYRTFGWYYVSAVLIKTIYDAAMFISPQMLNYIVCLCLFNNSSLQLLHNLPHSYIICVGPFLDA
jgi:hypothetical protein